MTPLASRILVAVVGLPVVTLLRLWPDLLGIQRR